MAGISGKVVSSSSALKREEVIFYDDKKKKKYRMGKFLGKVLYVLSNLRFSVYQFNFFIVPPPLFFCREVSPNATNWLTWTRTRFSQER